MSRIHDVIDAQKNRLERIAESVPGFSGYLDRENRREADKLLRDFGVSRLDRVISELHQATKAAALSDMDGYQELVNQAEKLRNELKHADRGYSGFFAEIKWDDESMLEALYEFDASIVEKLGQMDDLVHAGEFSVDTLTNELRELGRSFEDRAHTMLGLGSE